MAKKKKAEYKLSDFVYVDVHHADRAKKTQTKWIRTKLGEDVEKFRAQWNNYNVFQTVQRYISSTKSEGTEAELSFTPLFFDTDSSLQLMQQQNAKGIRYKGLFELGEVSADELKPRISDEDYTHLKNYEIGIEVSLEVCNKLNTIAKTDEKLKRLVWLKNLERACKDTKKILAFFQSKFGLREEELRVFFSGSKGFHIFVNPYAMGVKERVDHHLIYRYMVDFLKELLKLTSLDSSVYSSRRMIRMPNSNHQTSGRFKIELEHSELNDLAALIDEKSKSPREASPDDPIVELNDSLNDWYLRMVEEWMDSHKLKNSEPKVDILQAFEDDPVCVKHIMESGILKTGDRNNATMALASYYKDRGYPEHETVDILLDWVKKIPESMVSHTPAEVRASTISAVSTVYGMNKYHFGCPFILALHGEKQGKTYERVSCAGRACPMHQDHNEDKEPAIEMHLAKTADASYTGKKVKFTGLVTGKLDTPYIVPKKVQYSCSHVRFCDKTQCIMHQYNGVMDKEILEKERVLIEATEQNDNQRTGMLRRLSGALCNKVYPEVEESINVTELNVVPMAERVTIDKDKTKEKSVVSTDSAGYEYVQRKIYATDFEVKANQHYEIEGYVYNHPKNSAATLLAQKLTPMEESIDSFQITDEIKQEFKVFQVPDVATDDMEVRKEVIDNHLNMLIKDLEDNVTFVYERKAVHLGLLLTYHSCLRYYFRDGTKNNPALPEKRGWMEMSIVGDTGQAKSQLVDNLMNHMGLGNSINAEATFRTGLTYNMQKMGDKWFLTWGIYPLSDRRLLKIDEFSALDPNVFGTLTDARTEGVLAVKGMVNSETNARTRLVLLSNPAKPRRSLSEFTHGVQSMRYLFSEASDVRRLDLALFVAEGDVSPDVLHVEREVPEIQILPSHFLRNSVLWAWSRTEDQIILSREVKSAIRTQVKALAKKYGAAQDIPLLAPSDLDKKLARISIALAGLLHSTDETHEKIVVQPEHVHYVAEWLDLVYSQSSCQFDEYCLNAKEETELSEEEAKEIQARFKKLSFDKGYNYVDDVLEMFRGHDTITARDVQELLALSRDDASAIFQILVKHKMVRKIRSGVIKLPKLQMYLMMMRSTQQGLSLGL